MRRFVDLPVALPDGRMQTVEADSAIIASEVCNKIAVETNLKDTYGFSLFICIFHKVSDGTRLRFHTPFSRFISRTARLRGLTDSALDHRSLPPEFENLCAGISEGCFLRFITFGGRSAHLAYHIHGVNSISSIPIPFNFHLVNPNSNSTSNLSTPIQFQIYQFQFHFYLLFFTYYVFTMSSYSEYLLRVGTPNIHTYSE